MTKQKKQKTLNQLFIKPKLALFQTKLHLKLKLWVEACKFKLTRADMWRPGELSSVFALYHHVMLLIVIWPYLNIQYNLLKSDKMILQQIFYLQRLDTILTPTLSVSLLSTPSEKIDSLQTSLPSSIFLSDLILNHLTLDLATGGNMQFIIGLSCLRQNNVTL